MTFSINDITDIKDFAKQYDTKSEDLVIELKIIDEVIVFKENTLIPAKKVYADIFKIIKDSSGNGESLSFLGTVTKIFKISDGSVLNIIDEYNKLNKRG